MQEDPVEATNYIASIRESIIDSPEQPEPLQILRKLRRFDTMMWSGGYADQPHILMMELHTVIEAELAHTNTIQLNAQLRLQNGSKETEPQL